MLVATWIITFVIIVAIGVYSGTKIKSANQWSGGDKTMGAVTLGCVFAAWQIGGMAVVAFISATMFCIRLIVESMRTRPKPPNLSATSLCPKKQCPYFVNIVSHSLNSVSLWVIVGTTGILFSLRKTANPCTRTA